MTTQHEHWSAERVLEAALAGDTQLPSCVSCAAAVREERRVLARFRDVLAPAPEPAQRASANEVAQRVLARTTREDLGLRGDARLLTGFFAARLRSSALLRFAAASLLLHLFALPLLAWFTFVREPDPYLIKFELPSGAGAEATNPPEPEHEIDAEHELEDADLSAVPVDLDVPDGLEVQNALQSARHHLLQSPVPDAGDHAASSAAGVQLAARAAALGAARRGATAGASEAPRGGPRLALALWVETRLDHYVLTRTTSPALFQALDRLARDAAEADPGRELIALAALTRADGYGLLISSARARRRARCAALHAELGGASRDAARLLDLALRPGAPLDPVWMAALRGALTDAERADPALAAWL